MYTVEITYATLFKLVIIINWTLSLNCNQLTNRKVQTLTKKSFQSQICIGFPFGDTWWAKSSTKFTSLSILIISLPAWSFPDSLPQIYPNSLNYRQTLRRKDTNEKEIKEKKKMIRWIFSSPNTLKSCAHISLRNSYLM